ncbi:Protein of unknown function [Gryllus bimaculatus]|nr:Protein of unknown function [Gryllus bimaculatus]
MFSGLTNQVSSWMGGPAKKEGDPQQPGEEKLSSPVADIEPINIGEGDKKDVRWIYTKTYESLVRIVQ